MKETEEIKKITVQELLHEHMKFLAARAAFCKEDYGNNKPEDKAGIVAAMEHLQILMNRLDISEPEDPYLKKLAENRVFLGLSYDSKLLVIEHAAAMRCLNRSIDGLINTLEEEPKLRGKMRRSAGWRLFKFFSCLPWAGFKSADVC
jgi:hypothetical protein